jgi:hypothetical protein
MIPNAISINCSNPNNRLLGSNSVAFEAKQKQMSNRTLGTRGSAGACASVAGETRGRKWVGRTKHHRALLFK